MATLRELKGRIGSVASTEKITGAMKMISSAKMRKAETELRRLLPFRNQIESIIGNLLCADAEFSSPLTQTRPVARVAVVVLGSDDGLCGAYNVNILKFMTSHLVSLRKEIGPDVKFTIFPVGKKMFKAVDRIQAPGVSVSAPMSTDSKSYGQPVDDFCRALQQDFTGGKFDRVDLVYMRFFSAGRQRPQADKMLPLAADTFSSCGNGARAAKPYIFEPDAATIFRTVLPMYLQSMMQEVYGENRASEQAARVMAMQSASDNAKKLLEQLQLEYNKLRQQGITSELLDIVGGQVRD